MTYFVDGLNGSDDNDGTIEHPFKSVAKAFNSGANEIILFQTYVISREEGEWLLKTTNGDVRI